MAAEPTNCRYGPSLFLLGLLLSVYLVLVFSPRILAIILYWLKAP